MSEHATSTTIDLMKVLTDSLNKPSSAVSQPRKIYVVSTGRTMCEDYQIRGVFLDRDRALAWIETQPGLDERDLEEWYDGEVVL